VAVVFRKRQILIVRSPVQFCLKLNSFAMRTTYECRRQHALMLPDAMMASFRLLSAISATAREPSLIRLRYQPFHFRISSLELKI
jgi:hypothetical protein